MKKLILSLLLFATPVLAAQSNPTPTPSDQDKVRKAMTTFAKTIAAQRAARGQPSQTAPQKGGTQ